MKQVLFPVVVVCVLMGWNLSLVAQSSKDIAIDPRLEQNSEKYKVKLGVQVMGKMAKYKFGDYQIIEGKAGGTTVKGKSNLFNTKSETNARTKFGFVIGNDSPNRVSVNAASNTIVKLKQPLEVFSGFYVGDDELELNESNFTATLVWNQDTSQMWLLFLKDSFGTQTDDTYQGILTNGERTMHIVPASSVVSEKSVLPLPALGYEVFEDGRSWAALQYRGAGALGMNRCYVWLHNDIDPDTKLLLSGVMVTLLHKEMSGASRMMGGGDLDD